MKSTLITLLLALLLQACGGSDAPAEAPKDASGLTQDQLENGIGPIRSVTLNDIDSALAEKGKELFAVKCSACHKMGERYVGPALADVTERRTGAYIMNMILNPEEMIQTHPEAKALFAKFMTPMANQNLTEDEARAVLEFLRTQTGQ
jgi:cytochrome c551/c552